MTAFNPDAQFFNNDKVETTAADSTLVQLFDLDPAKFEGMSAGLTDALLYITIFVIAFVMAFVLHFVLMITVYLLTGCLLLAQVLSLILLCVQMAFHWQTIERVYVPVSAKLVQGYGYLHRFVKNLFVKKDETKNK